MNDSFLDDYNKNLFLDVCFHLLSELENVQAFIQGIRLTGEFAKLPEIEQLYENIFGHSLIKNQLEFEISRVLKPHYSLLKEFEVKPGNSTHFIKLILGSESLRKIDLLYDKRLTGLLRFYKSLFTILDKPSYSISNEYLEQYETVISRTRAQMQEFSQSQNFREIIDQREKLKSEIIQNLPFSGFYHMTHMSNLESILHFGLMSHNIVRAEGILKNDISNTAIQENRRRKESIYGRSIHDYVPLYINPLNPMMKSNKVQANLPEILILEIVPHILVQVKETLFSDGNAAEIKTNFYQNQKEMELLDWLTLQLGKWSDDESKRVMCSEILVPDKIGVSYINKIIVSSQFNVERILKLFPNHRGISVEINNNYFYN
jgi:hypothetical protein